MAKQPGRKSAAAAATKPAASNARRPSAPRYLTKQQRALWKRIVDSKSADWFTEETLPILEAYVVHAVSAQVLSQRVAELEESGKCWNGSASEYHKLLDLRLQESKAAEARARSLRLTNQSRWQPATAARKSAESGNQPRPWEE